MESGVENTVRRGRKQEGGGSPRENPGDKGEHGRIEVKIGGISVCKTGTNKKGPNGNTTKTKKTRNQHNLKKGGGKRELMIRGSGTAHLQRDLINWTTLLRGVEGRFSVDNFGYKTEKHNSEKTRSLADHKDRHEETGSNGQK